MKLQINKRSGTSKGEVSKLRRAGNIPAIIYHRGKEGEAISISNGEFSGLLRQVQPGRLSTTVFSLSEGGKERRVIIKEIQYHPTTYNVLHLDFEELIDNVPIDVKVPIEMIGVVDCVGVKLGGFLRQVIRKLKVRCLPKDLPASFPVDVKDLAQNEVVRLAAIPIPQTVKPIANMKEVAVLIAKR